MVANMSFSEANTIKARIHSSHIDDLSRFLIIRSRLKARSAEQLVTGSVTKVQYSLSKCG